MQKEKDKLTKIKQQKNVFPDQNSWTNFYLQLYRSRIFFLTYLVNIVEIIGLTPLYNTPRSRRSRRHRTIPSVLLLTSLLALESSWSRMLLTVLPSSSIEHEFIDQEADVGESLARSQETSSSITRLLSVRKCELSAQRIGEISASLTSLVGVTSDDDADDVAAAFDCSSILALSSG